MEQEKNLNEQEMTEEAVEEQVEEQVEETAEAVETVEQPVRPVVYDDFNEEEIQKPAKKEKKPVTFGTLVLSTIASSVISVIVTFCILFLSNAIPAMFTASQIDGVWALDMSEYNMGHIYVVFNDGKMSLTSEQSGVMLTCDYDVTKKNTVELSADEANSMMVSNLIGSTELKVTYDKDANALTFTPPIGGVATWDGVEKEQAKQIIEGLNTPEADVQDGSQSTEYEDITTEE